MDGSAMSVCTETGLRQPECSCPACVERMLRELQPGMAGASEPEITITRTATAKEGPAEGAT